MFGPPKLFYWVRPDFFHHNHIHRRKIAALRHAGIKAEMVAFVSAAECGRHRVDYDVAASRYDVRVVRIPGSVGVSQVANWKVRLFFVLQLIVHRRVVVQTLLSNPSPLYRLRHAPLLGKRLKLVQEFEGDMPSEMLYWATVNRPLGPLDTPLGELRQPYEAELRQQRWEIENSDAVVVVSQEHRELLNQRMGRKLNTLVFPTLFDANCGFSPDARQRLRDRLGFAGATVLVHLGGAVNPWHRFADLCRLVGELDGKVPGLRFLGLIRKTDLPEAETLLRAHGIRHLSDLRHVNADEVPEYLSAADVGLFLRHHHTMTRVTSSAKLGEYLACGLPVISTGAHAVFGDFMRANGLQLTIPESLEISDCFAASVARIARLGQDSAWRSIASTAAMEEFSVRGDPAPAYVNLCQQLLGLKAS
jgi:glycosyltransferase involved in cell wall biosynthesis